MATLIYSRAYKLNQSSVSLELSCIQVKPIKCRNSYLLDTGVVPCWSLLLRGDRLGGAPSPWQQPGSPGLYAAGSKLSTHAGSCS